MSDDRDAPAYEDDLRLPVGEFDRIMRKALEVKAPPSPGPMKGERDRISDLLAVLGEIRKGSAAGSPHTMRVDAVETVAQQELDAGRFKNLRSARNSINDALARRLGGRSLEEFDAMLVEWLRGESSRLEAAARHECRSEEQKRRLTRFFKGIS